MLVLPFAALAAAAQTGIVTSFTLVNANTDLDLGPLTNGSVLDLSSLPTSNLNVRANTSPATVGSVRFGLDANPSYSVESVAPYALAGDNGGNYNVWTPALGGHTIVATPYSQSAAGGVSGTALAVSFTVTRGNAAPTAFAGPDRFVYLPTNVVTLAGSATDDVAVMSLTWTQQSGPNTVALFGAATPTLTASGLVAGAYVFRLTATDGGAQTGYDEAMVTVAAMTTGSVTVAGERKKWHKVTLSFTGPMTSENASPNPFTDYRLDVTFTHPASGRSLVVPGYFAADGDAANTGAATGHVWRAHLAPAATGTWLFAASFRTGGNVVTNALPGAGTSAGYFDGLNGSFDIGPPDKAGRDLRGAGRLAYVGRHHLQFQESGRWFLKAGADSPENLLSYADFDGDFKTDGFDDFRIKTWSPHTNDWHVGDPTWQGGKGKGLIGAINYLASEGLNVFSFLTMNIGGDDKNAFPYTTYAERLRLDCSRLDQWEIVFEHGTRNGMYLHFKTQEQETDQVLDGGALGLQRRLYYRELIARFAHHLALNWNLGEENTNTEAQRKAFADFFEQVDPYGHPVVVHTFPDQKELVYSNLVGHAAFDGASLQSNPGAVFSDTRTWLARSAAAGRPWVVANDEQGGANTGVVPDADDPAHHSIRRDVMWGNVMAGGAGCEWYFGYSYTNSDLTCEDWRSRDLFWDQCRYQLEFFRNSGAPFWDLTNDNAKSTAASDYCLFKSNHTYLVYLKTGGTTSLDLTGADGSYEVRWYDPRNGGALQFGSVTAVTGGSVCALGDAPAETTNDWAILVRRQTAGLPPPWQFQDIGAVGATGSATHAGNAFTLLASGADIWGTADEFAFLHQSSANDMEIIARIDSLAPSNPWAKAGLMFRDGTNAHAAFVDLVVTPAQGVSLQWRAAAGATAISSTVAGVVAPGWLKLRRRGHMFTGYYGDDGANWTTLRTIRAPLAETGLVGVAVTSHSDGNLTTAQVSQVSISVTHMPRLLFVRGGPGTGGFLEGGADDQLADLGDFATNSGNHGWGELAEELIAAGYSLDAVLEGPRATNTPVDLAGLDLDRYAAIVFGSNNADYPPAQVDAWEDYIRRGHGAVFISDANFGTNWADASNSDQLFLDRCGLVMNQDNGTYALQRAAGDFKEPLHPVLAGVNSFDGEGVTPATLGTPVPGVTRRVIVGARTDLRQNDNPNGGTLRAVTAQDGALLVALAGGGRVACHFDRNTFFNLRGAGTSINRLDNRTYTRNLFAWLTAPAAQPPSADAAEAWRRYHFNEEDRTNAAVAGWLADPEGDGMPNLAEQATGSDPWVADDSASLEQRGDIQGFRVGYREAKSLGPVTLTLQHSTDASSWSNAEPAQTQTVGDVGDAWEKDAVFLWRPGLNLYRVRYSAP